ncbi:LemA family protein [Clostridium paraputrificum]|uniref:LemA family protein n=1 Tax=Clostridium paraputrificum TaxID=29363 RepID=A0A1B8RR84_9CLOT|nr:MULTISPECIES: LemA family protein [Clostridium]MBS6886304.1 LemA family protein [Clostridium sp.]MDB2071566.1 LemA family protein [Clostridium paraputrificum]MDB2081588.1 LemA family protein [Clostridium paraputrificum]MDB2088393.1 LemA family protein [Clostridium paraputrificum]MDB2096814.1 LemA family protein [Clostridium paraputrificum]
MSNGLKIALIVLAVILVIAIPIVGSYNSLVNLEQTVNKAESNIDTQLQRRSDLIPNLVNTVKGYASQEKDIFTDIANARSKLAGATSVTEQADADSQLSNALSRLLVVVERYPDLKSNQNFRDLSVQLEGTENRIAVARQDYNTAVTNYNAKRRRFPTTIISSLFGFQEKPLYKASAGATDVPSVDFNQQ